MCLCSFFFFQAEDGIRDIGVTGVQTCALPICNVLKVIKYAWGLWLVLTIHIPCAAHWSFF